MNCESVSGTDRDLYPDVVLPLVIGESKVITFFVKNILTGVLTDITGWKTYFTVRWSAEDPVATIAKRNLAAGGSDAQSLIFNQVATPGKWQAYLVHADSLPLDYKRGPLRWDAWVVSPAGDYKPVVKNSTLILQPSQTKWVL